MNWVHPTALLIGTWLLVFLQAAGGSVRGLVFAQPDLVPAMVVYAALYASLPTTAMVAVLGGLGGDAMSSGAFGMGAVPLLALGVWLHRRRDVILRDSAWAQASLGGVASAGVWFASYVLLFVLWPFISAPAAGAPQFPEWREGLDALPDTGIGRLWQWGVATVAGALGTPVVFQVFRWIDRTCNYQPAAVPMRLGDREIQRGRS